MRQELHQAIVTKKDGTVVEGVKWIAKSTAVKQGKAMAKELGAEFKSGEVVTILADGGSK